MVIEIKVLPRWMSLQTAKRDLKVLAAACHYQNEVNVLMNRFLCARLPMCFALILMEVCAQIPAKPADKIQWAGHTLRQVNSLSALPAAWQSFLGAGRADISGIADRGGRFNPTDVILDSKVPLRRFLIAGIDGDTALVAIERGGIALRVDAILLSNINGKPKVQRTWPLHGTPQSLRDLVDMI